jgi:hypothetical protein
MTPLYPYSLRNLALLIAFAISGPTVLAQMDFETAKRTTDFTVTKTTPFSDEGVGQLKNGSALIFIHPEIAKQLDNKRIEEIITVSIQLRGKSNGVYISRKTRNAFEITELQNGDSNVTFSYKFVVQDSN